MSEAGLIEPAEAALAVLEELKRQRTEELKRQFSAETYDKMLRNETRSEEQRETILAMRARRQAKEATTLREVSCAVTTVPEPEPEIKQVEAAFEQMADRGGNVPCCANQRPEALGNAAGNGECCESRVFRTTYVPGPASISAASAITRWHADGDGHGNLNADGYCYGSSHRLAAEARARAPSPPRALYERVRVDE